MLRTPEDVRRNQELRMNLAQDIVVHQMLIEKLLINDPANLLTSRAIALSEAHLHQYQANKEYDEYFETMVNQPYIPKKKLWQKLLRK